MRRYYVSIITLALACVSWAQTPPANATDITQMTATSSAAAPAAQTAVAPSAVIAAPPAVVRVYVDTLTGADAATVQGLVTQALFDSKQLVVTENQSNASLILKGTVWREAIPGVKTTSTRHARTRRPAVASSGQAGAATGGVNGATDISALLDSGNPAASADAGAANNAASVDGLGLAGLPGLAGTDAPADLSHYRYRLDLRLVNPDGDLIWMSGRGQDALPFAAADQAVSQTMAPMLATLKALNPAAAPSGTSPAGH